MLTIRFFTFSPVQENTYVLYNEDKKALIIDPGCYDKAEKETLSKFIFDNGLEVEKLLNTHCHLDHIFGNKWVHEKYGVELFLHPEEEKVLAFGPQSGIMWGLPFENYAGPLNFLNAGEEVVLGNNVLKVILAPGHSPGSICFYCEEQKFVIGGDVLFRESIGRTDLPLGDHQTLLDSIRTQLFVLPDEVEVYPGHGPSTTIGYEKKHNPFL
ncbi:MAG TPA: MBL fold metallo-hydrolase [Segetibacter sp.]|jgi:glyoxylase-like metal-dependent hydrolase (beta-lactamase superfamily II)